MRRALLLSSLAALAAAAPASGAYPGTYGLQGGPGIWSPNGTTRFVAADSGSDTLVTATTRRGRLLRSASIAGSFGVPTLITHRQPLGMFRGGRAFVLQSTAASRSTSFRVVRGRDLHVLARIRLRGSWAFDAVSPHGTRLYLVRHRSGGDLQHYVVRAYDLRTHRLLPGRIADRTQRSWVMEGWPVSRVTTRGGRWVYTLYANPGGYPFVHALDTVRGVAHCVGFAFKGAQEALYAYSLAVRGARLVVLDGGSRPYRSIDRRTWAVHTS